MGRHLSLLLPGLQISLGRTWTWHLEQTYSFISINALVTPWISSVNCKVVCTGDLG